MTPKEEVSQDVQLHPFDDRKEKISQKPLNDIKFEARPENYQVDILINGSLFSTVGADVALQLARDLNKVARKAQNLNW
jgi:hypothetical protein